VSEAGTSEGGPSGRTRQLPPFHCPYCGDEELTPHGEDPDGWHCGACLRTFTVHLTGTGVKRR
jgi:transposase-like protein